MNDKIKKKSWMTVEGWFGLANGLVVVGFIVFIISAFAHQFDGQLTAYYCMAIGIFITLIMSTILISRKNNGEGSFKIIFNMASLYLPSIATLVPIFTLIYIFTSVRTLIEKDKNHLPTAFYFYHFLSILFLFIQLYLLNKFLSGEINTLIKKVNPYKGAYVAGIIFSLIACMAYVTELYVIVTHFITDG